MRAAVYYGREDLRLQEMPEPEPARDEVKLRVLFNGICGSDLHEYYDGPITTRTSEPHPLTGIRNPVILGHELCGEIVAVGPEVEDLAIGDRIAVEPVETCGQCLYCTSGRYNHCGLLAFHGYNRAGGGLAQYTVVRRSMAHKLPPGMSGQQGALIEPMAIAWRTAERCGLEAGQTAVIHGAGPIGIGVVLHVAPPWRARDRLGPFGLTPRGPAQDRRAGGAQPAEGRCDRRHPGSDRRARRRRIHRCGRCARRVRCSARRYGGRRHLRRRGHSHPAARDSRRCRF